jgi:hypothetical protein
VSSRRNRLRLRRVLDRQRRVRSIPRDVITVYGAGSPEAASGFEEAVADFEGISIHCAQNRARNKVTRSNQAVMAGAGHPHQRPPSLPAGVAV